MRSTSENYENLCSRVKINNVNFRKSVVLWANSGEGGRDVITLRRQKQLRVTECLHVDTSGEGELTSISSGG